MIPSLVKIVRPAAVATAVVLVAGIVQAAPAAASPRDPLYAAISITAHVSYPADDDTPGSPGTDVDHPGDAGHAPGSVVVDFEYANVGTDWLQYNSSHPRPLAVGRLDSFECEQPPIFPPEDYQLPPTGTVHCTESISQIPAGVELEVGITVTAWGVSTGLQAFDSTRVWAEVDAPAPPPPTPTTSVGHVVFVDTNHDGKRDEGEPGIPGAQLSLQGPDGKPVKGVGDQTTDEHGRYSFDHLDGDGPYTVTLDLTSLDLTNRTPTSFTNGSWEPGDTRWSLSTGESADTWDSIDFGFFPKIPVLVDILGPQPTRVVGATWVGARTHYASAGSRAFVGPAIVEFRAGGTTTWTKIAELNAPDDRGYREASPTLKRSGWVRIRTKADRFFASGLSRELHVVVTTAPVLLYAQAPATVPRGTPLTVTGSITRSYYPFTTGGVVLERSSNGTTWTTVATLRSTKGKLTATVQPAVTGSYRFRYPGDSGNSPATSPTRRVVVLDVPGTPSTPPLRR
jgi:hypothetical protein